VLGYNAALEAAEAEIVTAAHVALDEALGTIGDEVQEVQVRMASCFRCLNTASRDMGSPRHLNTTKCECTGT
jgi:hypothetical protein